MLSYFYASVNLAYYRSTILYFDIFISIKVSIISSPLRYLFPTIDNPPCPVPFLVNLQEIQYLPESYTLAVVPCITCVFRQKFFRCLHLCHLLQQKPLHSLYVSHSKLILHNTTNPFPRSSHPDKHTENIKQAKFTKYCIHRLYLVGRLYRYISNIKIRLFNFNNIVRIRNFFASQSVNVNFAVLC